MAGSLNRATLIGNVGKDPEIRSTQSGDRIANLTVATSESWTDRNSGEKKESTEWHRVTVFNDGLVGVIEKYVKKGSKICVEGQIKTRKWTDKDGVEKYSTEINIGKFNGQLLLLGDPGGRGDRAEPQPYRESGDRRPNGARENTRASAPPAGERYKPSDLDDDEIPF